MLYTLIFLDLDLRAETGGSVSTASRTAGGGVRRYQAADQEGGRQGVIESAGRSLGQGLFTNTAFHKWQILVTPSPDRLTAQVISISGPHCSGERQNLLYDCQSD